MSYPLVLISNERVYQDGNAFYCKNNALKILAEGLSHYYRVCFIARKSTLVVKHQIKPHHLKITSNWFKLVFCMLQTFKLHRARYLLVGITPYTFVSFVVLFILRKKTYVYLISSGHDEWRHILGPYFVWIYHLMYKIVTSNSEVIVCHKRLYKDTQAHFVPASRLDDAWFDNHTEVSMGKVRLLYVGRISPEKGILGFLTIFNALAANLELSIVGVDKHHQTIANLASSNVNMLGYVSEPQRLIAIYDSHNILVLPSYTEAHPHVLDESLARLRPVIIFEDIAYIVNGRVGVFVAKRTTASFVETLNFIMKHYAAIQHDMKKNTLPTKQSMLKQMADIIG